MDNIAASKIFISFSGGLTSAFMTKYIIDNYKDSEKVVLFANTGKENEETLRFVNDCSKNWDLPIVWIEYDPQKEWGKRNWFKVTNFTNANRNGEPFEKFIQKERIPNSKNPGCSSRLKELPMHNYIKYFLGWEKYTTAVGIRFDEKHRINWKKAKKQNLWYPLAVDFPVTREYIHKWWEQQDFILNLKSYQGNCDCCWKKSKRKLLTIAKESPKSFHWWSKMEEKYGENGLYSFYRNNETAKDLLDQSKYFAKSKLAICDTKISRELNNQSTLFNDLDVEGRCSCNF